MTKMYHRALIGFSTSSDSGSLFVQYVANTGDVTVGRSTTPAAIAPTASTTFGGIQNQWNDNNLSVLFFARDKPTAESVFANFRILSGAPTAVPEPSQTVAASIGLFMMVWYTRRRRKRKLVATVPQGNTNC